MGFGNKLQALQAVGNMLAPMLASQNGKQKPYGQQQQGYGMPQQQQGYGQQQPMYAQPQQQQQQYYAAPPPQQYQQPQPQQQYQQPQAHYPPPAQAYPQSQPAYPPAAQAYGAPSYAQPAPQHYAPPASGAFYGGSSSSSGGGADNFANILRALQQCAQDQNLYSFYPQGALEQIAQRVASSGALSRLAAEWRIPMEIAFDICKIALFDVILYLDDSGSMQFEEQGARIDDLKLIVTRVSHAASLFDGDGIQVRFMNSQVQGNAINSEMAVQQLLQQVRFSGGTPLGTALDQKILQPLVLGPARAGALRKPVLIIAITDGEPGGEDRYTIVNTITQANRALAQTRYGPDAVSFQFAQVGNDARARAFLQEVDKHPEIGRLIDTTSSYEMEEEEMMRANPPVRLTPELWLVKLLLGGIDSSFDNQDE